MTGRALECQGCGVTLRELSMAEYLAVAERPYDYVMFCGQCKRDGLHVEEAYR